jgi:hypothetical protein
LLDKRSADNERRVLAVMTDGLENASREYTKESLKALLDRKQKDEGWLVLYLGAGHDSWAQAQHLGITAGNTSNFVKESVASASAAMYARQKRYAASAEPTIEAALGGFTAGERASMADDKGKGGRRKA